MVSTSDAVNAHREEFESASSLIDRIGDNVIGRALGQSDAETIFGEPVEKGDCTIIPVGRVSSRFGFGGGSGEGPAGEGDGPSGGGGGGGGGAIDVQPIGYIEITSTGSRFVAITDTSAVATRAVTMGGIVAILFVLGLFKTIRSRS